MKPCRIFTVALEPPFSAKVYKELYDRLPDDVDTDCPVFFVMDDVREVVECFGNDEDKKILEFLIDNRADYVEDR